MRAGNGSMLASDARQGREARAVPQRRWECTLATLARAAAALEHVGDRAAALAELELAVSRAVAALIQATERTLLAEVGDDESLIEQLTFERKRRHPPSTLARRRLRRLAIYLVAVEMQIPNVHIARALRSTRQNVCLARQVIEDLRDRPAVDALLDRCRVLLKGART